uniref:Uncharacterized protein n=1 Tax=Anopheles stephensi TaxID=30069 RepID=A0A182Y857_ANOST
MAFIKCEREFVLIASRSSGFFLLQSLVCLAVIGVAAAGVVPLATEYQGDYYVTVYASHAYAPAHGTVEYHGKAAAPLAYYH